jgi:hypothetical protein
MAHFVIGWLRNTSYYLFGSGSSGLGQLKRVMEGSTYCGGLFSQSTAAIAVCMGSMPRPV